MRSYLCFSTKFEVSADLTVIGSYKGLGFTFVTLINDLRNSTMLSLTNICVLFGDRSTVYA